MEEENITLLKKYFLNPLLKQVLQYHRYKCETNLLFSGKAQLVIKTTKEFIIKKFKTKI